jgi:hypothetical protein
VVLLNTFQLSVRWWFGISSKPFDASEYCLMVALSLAPQEWQEAYQTAHEQQLQEAQQVTGALRGHQQETTAKRQQREAAVGHFRASLARMR